MGFVGAPNPRDDKERLLYPLKLQRPYPGTPDGHLPEIYRQVLDPADALTYIAAQTRKIRLGTRVLDMPHHSPVVLARRLSTLDVLSNIIPICRQL